jgi:photosystem II stability/assembly factor-like uncharacterized protein
MRMKRAAAVAVVLAALTAGGASAAAVTSGDYGALRWRSIGPFRGGRVLAVSGASDDRLHFYFGAVNGGVWETRDAGRTWTPIFDDAPVGSIGALAVAPSAPKVLYAGSGEADMRSDIAQGVGMFKSTDGGKTWAASGLEDSQAIARIIVDPRSPEVVLAAVLGHPYGPNAQRGVFHSADGGKTWRRTLYTNPDTGAVDLAFRPGDPNTVYAALWQTRRPPWNVYPPSSGPGGGLYKSGDGGLTWTPLSGHGLPDAPGRIGLATSPSAPSRLYALIDVKEAGGLYRSDDDGANWIKVNGDKRIWERGWYFGGLTVNPRDPDEIWVCDTIVLHSTDGGRTFIPFKGDPTGDDFHALWIDPTDPSRRILGSDQGAQVTLNGGVTWSSWYNQPTGQFYHVITDSRFPYRVYGAQQDSGAADIPSRADGWDGVNMTHFHESAAGGESDNIAPDPDDPDTVYGGRVDKLDLRSGQVRDIDPTLAFPDRYRGTWTLPLVFGKRDHALYFANQRIFRTADGGQRWTPISPDLTRPDPGVPATLDAPSAADDNGAGPRKGVVYAIGPSPIAASDIWAGTDDGSVWRTRDGGERWTDVTPRGMTAWSKIGVVEPSHFDPQVAYIAVDRHRLDDFAPHIMRTRDGGKTWTEIVSGLAGGGGLNAVNVVREDPVRRGLLYAGTERGAFVSFDDGESWLPLQSGLPVTSVRDIDVHGADLVIATHGRGFYVMDDIEPLRELAADGGGGTRLFKPATAVRVRAPAFTGTPMPKDEPMAANPPAGAYIDYTLARAPAGAVEIAVSDAHGDLVAKFSSADTLPALDLAKISTAPEWIVRRPPPRSGVGAHRFVWDLRYPPPDAFKGDLRERGVGAPPGRYTVTLTVGGRVFRAPLDVVCDPRAPATAAASARQFALARAIEADRVKVHAAMASAKADPADTGAAKALGAVAERLDSLAAAVDGADGAPTPDAESGYRQASAALATALTAAKH